MLMKPANNARGYLIDAERHWQRRQGHSAPLTAHDFALLCQWKAAGIPLAAVLRGIDDTFSRAADRAPHTASGQVNGLRYCAPQVYAAAAAIRAATPGSTKPDA